jgi:CelD/BcsL family acetyltransferase involved in cellulose biosynthesis
MNESPNPERYEVRRLDDRTDGVDRWRRLVSGHDLATPYHTLAWKRSVERTFGYDQAYCRVVDTATGEDVAAVPGFETPETFATSLTNPFCEYGYPLLADGADPGPVLDALRRDAGPRERVLLKESPLSGVTGYREAGYGGIETGVTHRVPADAEFERLRADVLADSLTRRARRARQEGVVVRPGEDLDAFHRVYRETMARHGSPQFPVEFFRSLRSAFGDAFHYHVAETEDGDGPVAGLISLSADDSLHLLINGAVRRTDRVSPNPLLYLSVLESACGGSYDVVDFGRTEPGSGVDEFKSLFDGAVLPLVTFVAPPRHVGTASVSGYKRLAPLARLATPVITHPSVGPRLKRRIHE